MPDEIASQQTPAVPVDSATTNQDTNLAVKPDAESAPAQSGAADSDPAKLSEKMQRELQEQRRKRQLAEQENAYLRGQLDAKATQSNPAPVEVKPDTVVIPARPKMENFDSPDAYEAALDAYNDARVESKLATRRAQERLEEEQRRDRDRISQIDAKYSERMLAQKDLYPEVDESIQRIGRRLDPQMQLIIKKCDVPAALLTHLDQNPQELMRLTNLDPVDKALEMGQLVAAIKAKDKPQSQIRHVSQAPEPLKIPSSPGPPPVTEDDKMADADWFAREKAKRLENLKAMAGSR